MNEKNPFNSLTRLYTRKNNVAHVYIYILDQYLYNKSSGHTVAKLVRAVFSLVLLVFKHVSDWNGAVKTDKYTKNLLAIQNQNQLTIFFSKNKLLHD